MATLTTHLTCKGCGRRVPGTTAGFCGRCQEENEALAALQKTAERMRQMIRMRRTAARMTTGGDQTPDAFVNIMRKWALDALEVGDKIDPQDVLDITGDELDAFIEEIK